MDTPFSQWLITAMKKKNWSQADLARETRLSRQAIANYVDGRTPDYDALRTLARVFKARPETLFRIASGLPADPDDDPWVDEMSHKLGQLSPGLRGVAERFINSMLEGEEAEKKSKPKPNHKSAKV